MHQKVVAPHSKRGATTFCLIECVRHKSSRGDYRFERFGLPDNSPIT